MAKVRAKVSFAGMISMGAGEVRDIQDDGIVKDLISAGYVEIEKKATTKKKPANKRNGENEN